MKILLFISIFCLFSNLLNGCQYKNEINTTTLINLTHLEYLCQDISIDDRSMTIVRIYSEYPDYHYVGDEDEGIACVDDAARAAIFYIKLYKDRQNQWFLTKIRKLLEFLKYMQAENGLFYNFIHEDHSINKTHQNSIPSAGWWSWRAIWAFSEAYSVFQEIDTVYANDFLKRIEYTFPAIDSILQKYPKTVHLEGLNLPSWLPYQTAADQAAVMMISLATYYRNTKSERVRQYLNELSEGIVTMQFGDSLHFPFGCLLSWQNGWHAYGNVQAYALLLYGNTNPPSMFNGNALSEIKHFYPYLIQKGYLTYFKITSAGGQYKILQEEQFPQISYGIRPMVWASLKAYDVTGRIEYAKQAGEVAAWLLGKNAAGVIIYDPETGRCFDGLLNEYDVNKNAGAESTIEALVTIQAVEQNPIARQILWDYYKSKSKLNVMNTEKVSH
jgi:hypothetical protein